MFYDVITALLMLMTVAVFFQPNAERLTAAAIFVGSIVAHDFILGETTGFLYYGSAALFDLGVIALLGRFIEPSELVLGLQKVCIVSVVANAGGWVIWWAYWPPFGYNLAFVGLFSWALYILTKGIGLNVGSSKFNWRGSLFRGDTGKSRFNFQKHKGET